MSAFRTSGRPWRKIERGWRLGMNLTNDTYLISISTKNSTERYYRDKRGWVKESSKGRVFRATAEQVLNHLLPALAGVKPNVAIRVEHHDTPVHESS